MLPHELPRQPIPKLNMGWTKHTAKVNDFDKIITLDYEKQQLRVKTAIAKVELDCWQERIKDCIAQKNGILGEGDQEKKSTRDKCKQMDELSEAHRKEIVILDFEWQFLKFKMSIAKAEIDCWGEEVKEIIAEKNVITGWGV